MGWPSSWRGTTRSRGLAGRATGDHTAVFVVPPWDHSAVFVAPWGPFSWDHAWSWDHAMVPRFTCKRGPVVPPFILG